VRRALKRFSDLSLCSSHLFERRRAQNLRSVGVERGHRVAQWGTCDTLGADDAVARGARFSTSAEFNSLAPE
jgi:hypothetical protein